MHGLWLLLLIPGGAVVALDLVHSVSRPGVWLTRLAPALLVLGLVAFAHLRSTAFAVRLRKELRLALPTGLLLLAFAGAALCVDALPEGWLPGLVRTLSLGLAVVLPASAVLVPMTLELERGTLQESFTTALGARAFAEKFALAAVLVVLSWLQLTAIAEPGTELWGFALAGHLLALATAPAWFFFAQGEGLALGFVVILPFALAGLPALLWPHATLPVVALYGVAMLALTPRAVRRGLAAGPPGWMRTRASTVPFLERLAPPLLRAELRGQRDALVCGGVALLAFTSIRLFDDTEAASLVLIAFAGVAAMLSPVLAFTEAQRVGTLEAELSARPRGEVFRRRVAMSALTTAVVSVAVPLAVLAADWGVSASSAKGGLAVLLLMGLAWCVGLAVAVHVRAVGTALAVGLCLGLAALVVHAGSMALATWGALVVLDTTEFPALGPFMVATVVVMGASSAAVAVRRFLRADRLEPRVLLAATALSLTHAAAFGAMAVLVVKGG